jgi:hypothetical protein
MSVERVFKIGSCHRFFARMSMKRSVFFRSLGLALVIAVGFACRAPQPPAPKPPPVSRPAKPRPPAPPARPSTVEEVVARYGPAVDARLSPLFARAGVPYPPSRLHLLAFKKERKIELWAEGGGRRAFVRSFPVLGASGRAGPKLEEGDWQVPEGIYSIAHLNPQSAYHLSLRVDYPNDFDRDKARADGRTDLGGDIFIHGEDLSIGCLAVGNAAIEELFVLVARVGMRNARLVIAPNDLRGGRPASRDLRYRPSWLPELYARIRSALAPFTWN